MYFEIFIIIWVFFKVISFHTIKTIAYVFLNIAGFCLQSKFVFRHQIRLLIELLLVRYLLVRCRRLGRFQEDFLIHQMEGEFGAVEPCTIVSQITTMNCLLTKEK